ncbi:MAG: SDR family oxidoreductase [Myxococcales bacterium]|nr:SDR family oxidoreductase [Myxococcales bacterium]MCB9581166.1 SDR family oxidoreductase [Polyangiaceae bacterium]
MELSNKTALVTGASRGLGRALALALAERGARVVLVARDGEALRAVTAAITERGGQAFALPADVGDKSAIFPLVGAASATFGPIDVLIHNASDLGPTPLRLLLDTECEDLTRVLEVNLVGPFRLTKAVAGNMALRGSGVVVHVSSDAAVEAYPTWGAYSVSKAGLDHLSRVWAAELSERGVSVFSVDPGEMDTDMHRAAIPDADPAGLARPEAVAERIVQLIERAESIAPGARLAPPLLGDAA